MKKVLSYLLVLVLLIQIVPFSGYAASSAEQPIEQPVVYIDTDTYCRSGNTVTVDVCINNNPGFISTDFTVDFDSALTLIGATNGEAFASITDAQTESVIEGLTYVPPAGLSTNGQIDSACHFLWYANTIDDRNIKNGTIVTLVFKVDNNVSAYDKLEISVQSLSSNNIDKSRATYNLVANTVMTVLDYMPGDINNDGRLNVFDIVPLAQYISDGCKTIPESYNVTVNEKAADVTGDERINVFDLVFLSQYIADGCQTRKDSYNVKLTFRDPKCEHTGMTATGAQAATCTADGNIAYWYCADCVKYFSDAEATTEIAYADTVIAASGHTEVIDPAKASTYTETGLTEGSHCDVCGTVIIAQEITSMLTAKYHAITYKNLNGAESPTITQYAEHEGIAQLPNISVAGYEFKGWYTELDGGIKVTTIESGSTQDIELYARWGIIRYTITYDCGQGTNADSNVTSYTINDLVILSDAKLAGYLFDGWKNENGDVVTRINKGTIGDIVLTANWKTNRCLAHPIATLANPLYDPIMTVQEGDEYSFIYYLGYIESIPFGYVGTPYYHNGTISYSEEHSTSEATAESITKTVNKVTEDTRGWQSEVSISNKTEFNCPLVIKEELTVAVSHNQSGSHTTTEETGKSTTVSQEYVASSTEAANITPESSPVGWYRYVNYATIDVFATITYNAIEDKYYISNFNAVRDISTAWDYSASASFDDETDSDLPFELPESFYEFVESLTEATDGLIINVSGDICTVERYIGEETVVNIPSYYKNTDGEILKVVGFSADAFAGNTTITEVSLGQYITEIPAEAFLGCSSLESVTFNGEITTMGEKAFSGCTNLDIVLPTSLQTLGANAFDGCEKIDNVVIPASLSLGNQAFANCGELYVSAMPENVSQIDAIINSGATTLDLNITNLDTGDKAVEVGTLDLPDTINSFTLTGVYGQKYGLSLSAKSEQTTIKNVQMDKDCAVAAGELTLVQASIGGNLQFDGNTLLLQGTVELATVDSESEMLTVSTTTGNMAKLISNGGIQVSGDLKLSGVMDANIQGAPGRNGIQACNLTIDVMGKLDIYGGQGFTGENGISYNRESNEKGYAADGRNGGDGLAGENGKESIACEKLTILNSKNLSLSLTGGKGGTGGNGGNGEFAGFDKNPTAQAGHGGAGGAGGTGGMAIAAESYEIDDALKSLTITAGNGGDGGRGGNGGHADEAWILFVREKWSNPGSGGTAGAAGKAGSTEIDAALTSENLTVINGTDGKVGTAGQKGTQDYY